MHTKKKHALALSLPLVAFQVMYGPMHFPDREQRYLVYDQEFLVRYPLVLFTDYSVRNHPGAKTCTYGMMIQVS